MIELDGAKQTNDDAGDGGNGAEISSSRPNGNGNGQKLQALELDHGLILRAQRLTTGATVHRFSQVLTVYIGNVELWNRFVAQGPVKSGELEEKKTLRDRALALQLQLRQEVLQEELRSISSRGRLI
jgi:hypothetical protein